MKKILYTDRDEKKWRQLIFLEEIPSDQGKFAKEENGQVWQCHGLEVDEDGEQVEIWIGAGLKAYCKVHA